ncbi:AAA family ATPase [Rubinisphaera italica]|uniref:Protein CR006 P-loop domain-containing protein n=1 Tax=Rubinisphaera italica TaxID=2527969 RepID=A0A5C5XF38_9PLAN|nr:AAA family ATPase [Rubinisphaera italica]TWT61667.1 hypothetical protein Pan54_24040 [Rubinisphaera italica]
MTGTTSTSGSNVLSTIVGWCEELPGWQRDALRRIVECGEITATDVDELTALCRSANDLEEGDVPTLQPLTTEHVPAGAAIGEKLALCSVADAENVNAIGEKQELSFAPTGLTVVFGYNGSGKSGYGRILRRACRARSKGKSILPNVMSTNSGTPASAVITYALEDVEQPPEQWVDGQHSIECLGSVSFFDSECAAVHVRERNDIAFTPFGLDVLPKLGAACKEVQKRLDAEKKKLDAIQPKFLKSTFATGQTTVGKLLSSLRHDSDIDALESTVSLNDEEMQRLKDIPSHLANDPKKNALELRSRARRISTLREKLNVAIALSKPQAIQNLKGLVSDAEQKSKAAEAAARVSFGSDPLPEIGEPVWRELWEAARRYSAIAYVDRDFPDVDEDDSVCLLCQQTLGDDAKDRLRRFEDFVSDDTAKRAANAKKVLNESLAKLDALGLQEEELRELLVDLGVANADMLKRVRCTLAALLTHHRTIKRARESGDWSFALPSEIDEVGDDLQTLIQSLAVQATEIEKSADVEERKKLEAEFAELKAREWMATVFGDVKEHVARLAEVKKLKNCVNQTRTNKITAKSKELAKEHVTDQLRDAFATEIKKMQQGVRRLNVELAAAAGEFGSSYYRVQLVRAHDADIASVVSEGEHRCIALAGFLSELATEHSQSGIVFDDPVTSLDHHWRECFARRLVEEATARQVIVFTHDIVFLHDLLSGANQEGVPIALRRVVAKRDECGFVGAGLPWIAQKTSARIVELEKRARATRNDFDDHNDDVYDRAICEVYSDLRATVERAVEQHFFCGIITRHQDYISLSNLKKVTAVTIGHCERLQKLFKRCCDITLAHDRSSLRGFGVPSPDDALDDIKELQEIVNDMKDKQKAIA